ncbi:putative 2-oxoglutarate/Fe(II)-dependent dioxygenase YbiX [Caulobacter ginsengisoli]|uniref:2-oxoglutarate/Fe(II)-dependent dioxygenase YbiX n=1 Tax=Caulobacter ginsengisoli TaxID=400775 RepID=A0ABU0J014_9CAUL|nr:2OG-Fe(II) oxygenase [Caulobacter ginsengisoli]MDQ0466950.1 putative 2-oxoglutarate/Fe(II)-dependent dioxygenase YbiX [Caulobacter ginsengisoli]
MSGPLAIEAVLSPADLKTLLAALRTAASHPATVIDPTPGGVVMAQVRRTQRLELDAATEALIRARLEAQRPRLEAHFGQRLGPLETPQALRYGPGDYFVAHQDGNTPLVHDRSRHRRVSISLLISAPDDYAGGDLVFHDGAERRTAVIPAGCAVAFRAETTHEVTPLATGERFSLAAWWMAP